MSSISPTTQVNRTGPDLTSSRGKGLALALLAMTQFVIVIDASIVNVALPSIGAHLHFSRDDLSWVVNAYTLTFGGFLLLGGRLADLLGRRRMFMIGLVVFSLASLAGGLAQSEAWLIAARAVQGLGAAIVSPAALSIITTTFAEGAERNRALGIWGAVAGAGGAAGVLLGGILTSGLSWRWVLFVNVPIGLLAATMAPRLLLESFGDEGIEGFDVPGAVTVTAGLALLVYAVVDAVNVGWASTGTLLRLAGSLALLAAFVAIERRQRHPLLPFSIFRLRTLRGADVVGLLIGMSLFSMFFFISLYLQDVLHFSPIKAGVSYLPLAFGIVFSAGAASQLVTRFGFKPVLTGGLLLIAAGLLWFSRVRDPGGSYGADVLGPSLLAAFGDRHQATRGGARVGADQHLPAGRGRARPRDPGDGRQQPHPEPAPRRRAQSVGRAHERLRPRLPDRHGLRARRRDPDRGPDLLPRQPRAGRSRAPRRSGDGVGRGVSAARRRQAGASGAVGGRGGSQVNNQVPPL
jgi:EmrB/QacA subfamily drug resistance transporter